MMAALASGPPTAAPSYSSSLNGTYHHSCHEASILTFLTSAQSPHAVTLFTLAEGVVSPPFVAAECAFAALDALAAFVVRHGRQLQSPKSSALVLTACISIGWKLASRDAAPNEIAACWNRLALHGPGVRLDTREIVEQETELLMLLRFDVALPSWWIDVSQFTAAYISRWLLLAATGCSKSLGREEALQDLTNSSAHNLSSKRDPRGTSLRDGRPLRVSIQSGENPALRNDEHIKLREQRRYMQMHVELLATNVQAVLLDVALTAQPQFIHGTLLQHYDRPSLHGLLCTALTMTGVLPYDVTLSTFSLSSS
jgi:hypothetical protein